MRVPAIFTVGFLVLIIVSSPAICADPVAPHHEHLKALEILVGTWSGQGETSGGEKIEATTETQWSLHKSTLSTTAKVTTQGKVTVALKEYLYWDQAKQQIGVFTLSSLGEALQGKVTINADGTWIQEKSGWGAAQNRPIDGVLTFAKQDEDTIRCEAKIKVPGEAQADPLFWMILKRVKE